MKKIFLIFVLCLSAALTYSQNVIIANRVMVRDSFYLGGKWYTTITNGLTKAQADLLYVALQPYPPLATLTGGINQELIGPGAALPYTLNWGATRQSGSGAYTSTAGLQTITVAGVSQSFINPLVGATVTGSQGVTVVRNTNTTFTNTVLDSAGKSASATTTFNFLPTYYIGFVNTVNPTDANIIASTGGSQTLTTSRIASGNTATPTGAQYLMFAYPASEGAATISINGLVVAYNLTTRALTNASGYTQSYNIYISPNPTNSSVSYAVN